MTKLSVNETKWSSLLARTRALIFYISIFIFDFGPEKLPGLARNGPQERLCPSWYYRRKKVINVFSTQKCTCVMARTEMSRNPLIVQSRFQHGQRTWAESSSLQRSVLCWFIQSYFEIFPFFNHARKKSLCCWSWHDKGE